MKWEEKGMVSYGYARVSTNEQNPERQIQAIKAYRHDMLIENIFIDKQSGKTFDRPNYNTLKLILENLRKSSKEMHIELIIEELDRIGRTKEGIRKELEWYAKQNIFIHILEIPTTLIDIDAQNEWVLELINKILIEVYSSLAEQEMDKRVKRQSEGIAEAKKQGVYKGRKPIQVNENQFIRVYKEWKGNKIKGKEAMQILGLKPNTFYRRVKEYEASLSLE